MSILQPRTLLISLVIISSSLLLFLRVNPVLIAMIEGVFCVFFILFKSLIEVLSGNNKKQDYGYKEVTEFEAKVKKVRRELGV